MNSTNFKRLGEGLPVGPLMKALAAQPHLFEDIPANFRNTYPGSAHQDSRSILLRWCYPFNEWTALHDLHAVDYPACYWLTNEASPLVQWLSGVLNTNEIGRVMVNALLPNGVISTHVDEGAYADHYDRFHIVLRGGYSPFQCGNEIVSMQTGEAWWFDHRQEHSVVNNDAVERVHLIVDAVAPHVRSMQ